MARTVFRSSNAGVALIDGFRPFARPLSAAIATTCMLGSLYFSEIVNYKPCRLCWMQRGAMYPLAIMLVIFTVLKTPGSGASSCPSPQSGRASRCTTGCSSASRTTSIRACVQRTFPASSCGSNCSVS
ncbi:MAG: disulfide bond formation protein B [Actinobacteria bacterium]|nr:disulfide bond formation protein B [Actinomycetota bacterium]